MDTEHSPPDANPPAPARPGAEARATGAGANVLRHHAVIRQQHNDDPRLAFLPEEVGAAPISESNSRDRDRHDEAPSAPQGPLRKETWNASAAPAVPPTVTTRRIAPSERPLPVRMPARVPETRKAHRRSNNRSIVSFLSGTAVGALGMWLVTMQPALDAPRLQMAPLGTAGRALGAPASAHDAGVSRDPASAGSTTTVPSTVPSPPAPVAASSRSARDESPPVTPLIPSQGALLVDSEPSGARVFVNGQPVGSTPVVLKEMPVGSRVVRVEADGYRAWSAAIRVVANQETRLDVRLDRVGPGSERTPRP
jgi:hypothetical protein